jgi:hypothetical protein
MALGPTVRDDETLGVMSTTWKAAERNIAGRSAHTACCGPSAEAISVPLAPNQFFLCVGHPLCSADTRDLDDCRVETAKYVANKVCKYRATV